MKSIVKFCAIAPIIMLLLIGCCSVIGNNDDIVKMEVYEIHYDQYLLKDSSGHLWQFDGCPLEPLPVVGETVLINKTTMEWVE